jgi:acyl-CoA hydrolase
LVFLSTSSGISPSVPRHYRDSLHGYLETARPGHFRHDLDSWFELHRNFIEHGRMLP